MAARKCRIRGIGPYTNLCIRTRTIVIKNASSSSSDFSCTTMYESKRLKDLWPKKEASKEAYYVKLYYEPKSQTNETHPGAPLKTHKFLYEHPAFLCRRWFLVISSSLVNMFHFLFVGERRAPFEFLDTVGDRKILLAIAMELKNRLIGILFGKFL
jgi:hypothetical protein